MLLKVIFAFAKITGGTYHGKMIHTNIAGKIMSNPLVSVVIPAYNREKTISYCLDSVINQTYENLEIIVVDDCSKDRTVEIVMSYSTNDKRIKLIKLKKKLGAQAARNWGIKEAGADWIAFLDSDDVWLPKKIEKQVKILEQHGWEPFIVIHSDAIIFNEKTKERRPFGIKKVNGKNVFLQLLESAAPMFQAMITSKKALESINFLDENVPSYQEWDIAIRLAEKCEFVFIDEATFIYHLHDGETISKDHIRDIEGYGYVIKKFENEIKRHCGRIIWYNHLNVQYQKCRTWKLKDKAKYYLQEMSFLERIKVIMLTLNFIRPIKVLRNKLKEKYA